MLNGHNLEIVCLSTAGWQAFPVGKRQAPAVPFGASVSALLQYNLVQFRDCSVSMTDSAKSDISWKFTSFLPDLSRSKTWRMLLVSPDRLTIQAPGWTRVTVDFSESIEQLSFRIFRAWATWQQDWNGMILHNAQLISIVFFEYIYIYTHSIWLYMHTTVCNYVLCFNGQRSRRGLDEEILSCSSHFQVVGGRTCHIYSGNVYHIVSPSP